MRAIAMAESFGVTPKVYSSQEQLAEFSAKFANHVYRGYIIHYPEYKPLENDFKAQIEELGLEAKAAVQPEGYIVSVVKVQN